MLSLCRLRTQNSPLPTFLRRFSSSTQGATEGASASPPPQNVVSGTRPQVEPAVNASFKLAPKPGQRITQGRRRPRREPIPPQRPKISSASPRKWNRPIAEGVLPAYDLALKVIRTDSIRLAKQASELKVRIAEKEKKVAELGGPTTEAARENEEALEKMREKLYILQVQSEINLPEVRWRVANAMVDMTQPVHRHLMEQKWRKEGGLDLLMERIHQMKVIPDVLPDLRPSIDLHITVRASSDERKKSKKMQVTVEPGTFLLPAQTVIPPKLYANVFHTDTRLYTMLLVDPDVPNEEEQTFRTFLHWMKPNVPLSALYQARILDLNSHTPYIPPHPQRGTPYHRYVLLLLPQPPASGSSYTRNGEVRAKPGSPTSVHLEIPPITDVERRHFDVRDFMRQWGLEGIQGGAHMWREVWSETVPKVYADVLKEEEPRYGRHRKADPYAEVKRRKRYV